MPIHPSYWKVLTRRKILKNESEEETKLHRVLGLFDLTTLGVGSTLGAGVYVLAGQIAKDQAGPSVMISFAIAALASVLAGICYAEFGARVPKAGSAYIYSYVCIGEFVAFIIGWNLILEYVIGTAGVCRGISLYLDTLLNDTMKTSFANVAPIHWNFLGEYFDFFAFGLAVVFGVGTAFGVETSTMLNNFCTLLNISVLIFVIIAGSIKADISNWQVDPLANFTGTGYNIGKGGYFPFGVEGTLKGAATCFFGFVGFDCIATTGEEVRNPEKNIPRSILYSLLIIFFCYFGVSTVLTLMVPYYLQDPNAPLPFAFKQIGWNFAMWIVTIGGLIGLLASLFGALFPIPRVIYSMAEDGLLFRFLGKISPRFRTPVTGSVFAAFLTGLIAGLFNLAQLVNLLSIGTLLAYTVVAISVTILRFMDNDSEGNFNKADCEPTENSMLTSSRTRISCKRIFLQMINFQRLSTPNSLTTKIVGSMILFFCLISLLCGVFIMMAGEAIVNHDSWAIALISIFVLLLIIVLIAIWMQPKELYTPIFREPLVPLLPAISIFINIYLMLQLDVTTWIRFGFWMVIGMPIFIICYCPFDKSSQLIQNRKKSFMGALKGYKRKCNDQLKVAENGFCNNSVRTQEVSALQPEREENQQLQNEETYYKLSLDEVPPSLLVLNDKKDETLNNNIISESIKNGSIKTQEDQNIITVEDENLVIAILDDVLEHEDDDIRTPDEQQKSFDSEIAESSEKIITLAMVHNNNEINLSGANNILGTDTNLHAVWQLAFDLVNDILQSDELIFIVEAKTKCNDQRRDSIELRSPNSKQKKRATNSESSEQSVNSLDVDPLHSENFKNKLSQLIVQPPLISRLNKNESNSAPKEELSRKLKQSKSEADIRQMVLRAIEGTASTENAQISRKQPLDIPLPPKFDPVLYKTVGQMNSSNIRARPSINKLIENRPTERPPLELLGEEVPFKERLEAMLKRGPSHRLQKPSDLIPQQHISKKETDINKPIKEQSKSNKIPPKTTRNTEEFYEIRNKLRHVNIDKTK